jgi:hypothetical protein
METPKLKYIQNSIPCWNIPCHACSFNFMQKNHSKKCKYVNSKIDERKLFYKKAILYTMFSLIKE